MDLKVDCEKSVKKVNPNNFLDKLSLKIQQIRGV